MFRRNEDRVDGFRAWKSVRVEHSLEENKQTNKSAPQRKHSMKITDAGPLDRERIHEIYLRAFDDTERETVANLAVALLSEASAPRPVHLIANIDDKLVGHVSFSPVLQKGVPKCIGYILAPLAVSPSWQKRGIGTALVGTGIGRLKLLGDGVLFVYGDPGYYRRFGFSCETAERFVPPFPLRQPLGWQALSLGTTKARDTIISIECVSALCLPELW